MKTVLVATDLTEDSENAFIRAIQLSRLSGAKLHALHVEHTAPFPVEDAAVARDESRDRIRDFIGQHATAPGVDCEIHVEKRGRVDEAIENLARTLAADLVVIGRSKRVDAILGSVLLTTGRIIANAHWPVLVVSQPVAGNYRRILLEADLSASPESILTPVRHFGPDIELTFLSKGAAQTGAPAGLVDRFLTRLQSRRSEQFRARAAECLQQVGLSGDRVSIQEVAEGYDAILESKLDDENVDLVALSGMRRKLRDAGTASRLLAALQRASCDVLGLTGD